jgi:predicted secreted protein
MGALYQFGMDWSALKNLIWFVALIAVEIIAIRCCKARSDKSDTVLGTDEPTVLDNIGKSRQSLYAMAITGLCFTVILLLYFVFNSAYNNYNVYQKFNSGEYSIVSGKVHDFESDGKKEEFYIDDVQFTYYKSSWLGYHRFKDDGGVITGDGQQVTIGYLPYGVDNVIVYIE